jgi:hypothetical protein
MPWTSDDKAAIDDIAAVERILDGRVFNWGTKNGRILG